MIPAPEHAWKARVVSRNLGAVAGSGGAAAVSDASSILGRCPAVTSVLQQFARWPPPIQLCLLLGETGTGKELFASELHQLSARRGHAMVRVNCAAIPSTLIESELFGREKGAFTGALARQIGRFELAEPLDDLSRRDRRSAGRGSGQAAPRARGAADRAARESRASASTCGSSPPPIEISSN